MKNLVSSHRLRLESLEERTLLAVTAGLAETAAPLAAPTGATNWVVNTTADPSSWDTADDILSLREAIGRAQAGDTITFDASLAGRTITLSGSELSVDKGITIDANGIGGMTINANSKSRVFSVSGGTADAPVELISLTITSGNSYYGISWEGFADWVKYADGSYSVKGGGIYNSGTLTLTSCTVSGNNAGIDIQEDPDIDFPRSYGGFYAYGGGIYSNGTLMMTNCTVSGNTVAVVVTDADSHFNSCSYGGGIYSSGTLTMTNCTVAENTVSSFSYGRDSKAYSYGGGIYYSSYSGTLTMTNCTVLENTVSSFCEGRDSKAYSYGGGIYNSTYSSTLMMTNCTVAGNTAIGDYGYGYSYGGGIYNDAGTLTLTNCTVSENTIGDYGYGYSCGGGIYKGKGTLTLTNCTVSENSANGYYDDDYGGGSYGGGIYNDLYSSTTIKLYNTIIARNTARSSGDDVYRSSGSLYAYNTISSFTGWKSGSSGNLVYDSALPLFADSANGDYTLAKNSQAINKGNNEYVEVGTDLAGNPRIVGGTVDLGAYEYQEETIFETPSTVVTTILDVVDLSDGLISLQEAISYAESGDTITFDVSLAGQIITLCGKELAINKTISIDASEIGGITVDADGKSCVFDVSGGTSEFPVELIGLTIVNGWTADDGGGIFNGGYLTLTNCTVSGNTAEGGGGIFSYQGTLTLTNCAVTGNSATSYGGGIFNEGDLTLTNCTVAGNTADYGGGIFDEGYLTLTNCTVAGNTADYGGGIYSGYWGTAYIYNTIVAQNTASSSGSDIYSDSGSLYTYNTLSSYTDWTDQDGCLVYDSSFPLFTDAANGDYTLAENSQAIDKGNNEYVETETDLAGNSRIAGGTVDLGAYEYQSGGGQTEPLAAPTITTGSNRVYVSCGANRHQIQWSAVANASGYELAYSADGNAWTTVSASGTSAVVTGLTYGAAMRYRVRALGTGSYTDSDWSAVKTFSVCPMDINGDGDISGGDRTLLGNSWLAEEGEDEFRYYCDITGDGDIGGADRVYLSNNWLLNVEDDADDLQYPLAKASDAVFAEFASADLDTDLGVF